MYILNKHFLLSGSQKWFKIIIFWPGIMSVALPWCGCWLVCVMMSISLFRMFTANSTLMRIRWQISHLTDSRDLIRSWLMIYGTIETIRASCIDNALVSAVRCRPISCFSCLCLGATFCWHQLVIYPWCFSRGGKFMNPQGGLLHRTIVRAITAFCD